MNDLPDAPYIRDAELNGYPGNDPVKCPICGSDRNDYIFLNKDGEVLGCECCLSRVNIWDWAALNGGGSE